MRLGPSMRKDSGSHGKKADVAQQRENANDDHDDPYDPLALRMQRQPVHEIENEDDNEESDENADQHRHARSVLRQDSTKFESYQVSFATGRVGGVVLCRCGLWVLPVCRVAVKWYLWHALCLGIVGACQAGPIGPTGIGFYPHARP